MGRIKSLISCYLCSLFPGLTGFDSVLERYESMPGVDRTARIHGVQKLIGEENYALAA